MAKAKPLKILIVEDEPLLVMDVEMMVEDSGHQVIGDAASLGEVEALTLASEPDLVFVDMQLAKGSNGLDVSALVQRRWPEAFIVYVTANPRMIPEDFAGGHGVIAKPFSRTGFLAAMRYLEEGIIAPPPSIARPVDFVGARALDAWQVAT
ncbi:CheY-like chemotaxis protein [Bosea sp. BE125]|uniref:response regulator n=1 Tax=Bosea sp. BE125 TaxID=2817909 RepID=UPI00285C961D|nr:response regulator [Bosea sp. BE125]MDR6872028.1 CheY-like chemotaxis protein [Bosea sp. BE125]